MIEVRKLEKYDTEVAQRVRELLVELSRSGKDKGEIAKQWFLDIIDSPWHDLLIAYDGEEILGMATVSVIMGAGIRKNIYLEDFVVGAAARGKGVGGVIWEAVLKWGREHGAKRLEFTCGQGREAAQAFYRNHGAEIYDTNFLRVELN